MKKDDLDFKAKCLGLCPPGKGCNHRIETPRWDELKKLCVKLLHVKLLHYKVEAKCGNCGNIQTVSIPKGKQLSEASPGILCTNCECKQVGWTSVDNIKE